MNAGIRNRLAALRKAAGLSQVDLGNAIGTSGSLVSRWESGDREPTTQQVLDLARTLGVSVD